MKNYVGYKQQKVMVSVLEFVWITLLAYFQKCHNPPIAGLPPVMGVESVTLSTGNSWLQNSLLPPWRISEGWPCFCNEFPELAWHMTDYPSKNEKEDFKEVSPRCLLRE